MVMVMELKHVFFQKRIVMTTATEQWQQISKGLHDLLQRRSHAKQHLSSLQTLHDQLHVAGVLPENQDSLKEQLGTQYARVIEAKNREKMIIRQLLKAISDMNVQKMKERQESVQNVAQEYALSQHQSRMEAGFGARRSKRSLSSLDLEDDAMADVSASDTVRQPGQPVTDMGVIEDSEEVLTSRPYVFSCTRVCHFENDL